MWKTVLTKWRTCIALLRYILKLACQPTPKLPWLPLTNTRFTGESNIQTHYLHLLLFNRLPTTSSWRVKGHSSDSGCSGSPGCCCHRSRLYWWVLLFKKKRWKKHFYLDWLLQSDNCFEEKNLWFYLQVRYRTVLKMRVQHTIHSKHA